jgi:hypothetical protein
MIARIALLVALSVAVASPANADLEARWKMNEASNATTMIDSVGSHNGHIGLKVTPTGRIYKFPGKPPNPDDYQPGRIVTVPESDALDPQDGAFGITIRFKTRAGGVESNMIQKGQANQTGGYWKFVVAHGWPRCHFRDSNNMAGIGLVGTKKRWKVNDGHWHTVRCERRSNGRTYVTLNPGTRRAITRVSPNRTDSINNSRPLVIGGKLDCAAADVGCDYMKAKINWVKVMS